MKTARLALLVPVALALWLPTESAQAWELFRSENANVRTGNERLRAGDARAAIDAYDRAARELPSEGAVHLNRGLALMEAGDLDAARRAFLTATEPPAPPEVRADAYYDLGLAFYRQGDEAAGRGEHGEATRLFREAADAFRRSLRIRPGNADAGWNLELALRRIVEEEEREREEQDDQEQDDQEQDDQEQDDQEQDDQEQDDQEQDEQEQDGEGEDEGQQGEDQQDREPEEQDDDAREPEDPSEPEPRDDEGEQEREPEPPDEPTRTEAERVLDALQDSEENLERHRARSRAARERRRVEQDW